MKFMVGRHNGGAPSVFVVSGSRARNLSAVAPEVGTDLTRLAAGMLSADEIAMRIAEAPGVSQTDIEALLPIARPSKIICLGLNYVDHVKEGGYEIPDYPALFMRGLNSIMAAGAAMVRPACSERLDYEAELMVIIGSGGRHIAESEALSSVFGYTVFNDGSVRDYQRKTHQWTPGKNFDATGAIGPIVATPDEVPPGATGLKIESRVGSEILQSANTSDMMWPVAKAIAIISEYATLEPGDLIAMGTPPGVGHARTPPRWLVPGEVVDIEIERIGICSSPIVAEEDLFAKAAE